MIGRMFPSDYNTSHSNEVTNPQYTAESEAEIPQYTAETFQRLLISEEPLLIIDLRLERVFHQWHIAGSFSQDLERFYRIIEANPEDWLSRQVVFLCYGGKRSGKSAKMLMQTRYDILPEKIDGSSGEGIIRAISQLRKTYQIPPPQKPPLSVFAGVSRLRAIFKDYQLHGIRHTTTSLADSWTRHGESLLFRLDTNTWQRDLELKTLRDFLNHASIPVVIDYEETVDIEAVEQRLPVKKTVPRFYTSTSWSQNSRIFSTVASFFVPLRLKLQGLFSYQWIIALLGLQICFLIVFRYCEIRLILRNAKPFYFNTTIVAVLWSFGVWLLTSSHWQLYARSFTITFFEIGLGYFLFYIVVFLFWGGMTLNGVLPSKPQTRYLWTGILSPGLKTNYLKNINRLKTKKWVVFLYGILSVLLVVTMDEGYSMNAPTFVSILLNSYIPIIVTGLFFIWVKSRKSLTLNSYRWLLSYGGIKFGVGDGMYQIATYVSNRPGCVEIQMKKERFYLGIQSGKVIGGDNTGALIPEGLAQSIIQLCHQIYRILQRDVRITCTRNLTITELHLVEPHACPGLGLHETFVREVIESPTRGKCKFDATPWEEYLSNPTPLTVDIIKQRFIHRGASIRALRYYGFRPQIQDEPGNHFCQLGNKLYKNVAREQLLFASTRIGLWIQKYTTIRLVFQFVKRAPGEWVTMVEPQFKNRIKRLKTLNMESGSLKKRLRRLDRVLRQLSSKSAFWQEKIAVAHVTLYQYIEQICRTKQIDISSILSQYSNEGNKELSVISSSGYELYRKQNIKQNHQYNNFPYKVTKILHAWRLAEQLRQKTQNYYIQELEEVAGALRRFGENMGMGGDLAFLHQNELNKLGNSRSKISLIKLINKRKLQWEQQTHINLSNFLSPHDIEALLLESSQPTLSSLPSSHKLRGICVSGSQYPHRGKAMIVNELRSIPDCDPDSILVTSEIPHDWIPNFSVKPLGIISETGGMLSHSAILLREAGIPAIVGVREARQRIVPGQLIELSSNGEIHEVKNDVFTWRWLEELGSFSDVSNKAGRLGTLLRRQLPVPTGVLIHERVLQECIVQYGDSHKSIDTEIPPFLIQSDLPTHGIKILQDVVKHLKIPSKGLIVRSAANIEDQTGRTMAGLFRSEGPVHDFSQLIQAVCRCWQSKWIVAQQTPGNFTLDLIIQHYVEHVFGGVLFTQHPVSHEKVFVIEMSEGVKSVVGGTKIPTRYVVEPDGKLISQEGSLSLQDSVLKALIKYGAQLESLFGMPQDIEWVFDGLELFIVQTRNYRADSHTP